MPRYQRKPWPTTSGFKKIRTALLTCAELYCPDLSPAPSLCQSAASGDEQFAEQALELDRAILAHDLQDEGVAKMLAQRLKPVLQTSFSVTLPPASQPTLR
jgi:hypothetical protein